MTDLDNLKAQILRLTAEYASNAHRDFLPASNPNRATWLYGDTVPYAGRVFEPEEVVAAVEAALQFWLTLGINGDTFESKLSEFLGVEYSLFVNSGSSANLIAISTLTSHKLPSSRRLMPGDEVITAGAGFPTTVSPIIQCCAVPVFLDVSIETANILSDQLELAYTPGKTKAVILAHALGIPFDISSVLSFCRKYNLWLIEDNCDALGSTYTMPLELASQLGHTKNSPGIESNPHTITRWTGTWGDISTQSFYPPHHITTGEGGAVNIVKDIRLKRIAESFRDWGRDCWCPSGRDNSCNRRYSQHLGTLPPGYDHKYTYSHFGYNLKPLDLQAAIGTVQLSRLPGFIKSRKENWTYLRTKLSEHSDFFHFSLPTHAITWEQHSGFTWDESLNRTDPSWFGFMVTVRTNSYFSRNELVRYLEDQRISTRMFFGGHLPSQPAFTNISTLTEPSFRCLTTLDNSINIMNNSFFIGVYPGMTVQMLDYIVETINNFLRTFK